MHEDKLNAIRDGRARYELLRLVRLRHRAQQSRMDHVELWHMLRGLGLDVGENDIITYLQDLESADLVKFTTERNGQTNRVTLLKIEMCPRGLRVLGGQVQDDLVLL